MTEKDLTENERKKQYLKSYQRAVRREQEILEEIQRLRASKMFPALSVPDGMPHGSGSQSDLSEYAVILDEEIEKLKREMAKKDFLRRDIERKIKCMSDDNERMLLRLRYIEGFTWERVADELGYSWRGIHRVHSRALEHFDY